MLEKSTGSFRKAKPKIFDLYFMLRHRELVKFIPKDIENLKVKLLNVLQNGWEKELKLFLPVSYQTLIKDFQERLKKEIDLHIAEN